MLCGYLVFEITFCSRFLKVLGFIECAGSGYFKFQYWWLLTRLVI